MNFGEPHHREAGHYFRTVFDANPLPTFVVDVDISIHDCNKAARQLLDDQPDLGPRPRGGEALRCLNANPKGCGQSQHCRDCVIRGSVREALAGGKVLRRMHRLARQDPKGRALLNLLVSAAPLPAGNPPLVILILEDITELLALWGLIPICARCKKVRNDEQYWQSIETYLHQHLSLDFTHGYCPNCLAAQMEQVKALAGRSDHPAKTVDVV